MRKLAVTGGGSVGESGWVLGAL